MKNFVIHIAVFISFFFCISMRIGNDPVKEWKAAPEADKLINPFKGNDAAVAEGKKLYAQVCIICHGEKGKGDGVGGITLTPRPGNFTSSKVQAQSDGALFWKMTEGRPPMASYKPILTDLQRWQLVNYIRTFSTFKK
ncbi:MAG: c-type cytochrome [Bacteroidia bacterium]